MIPTRAILRRTALSAVLLVASCTRAPAPPASVQIASRPPSQERWRLFFIGTTVKDMKVSFPFPTHSAPVRPNFTGGRCLTWLNHMPDTNNRDLFEADFKKFVCVRDAIGDLPRLRVLSGEEPTCYNGGPYTDYQRTMRD